MDVGIDHMDQDAWTSMGAAPRAIVGERTRPWRLSTAAAAAKCNICCRSRQPISLNSDKSLGVHKILVRKNLGLTPTPRKRVQNKEKLDKSLFSKGGERNFMDKK